MKIHWNYALMRRFGFYAIGLVIGIYLTGIIFEKKKVSFDYFANARTLKSIRNKTLVYTDSARSMMKQYQIDTAAVNSLLRNGNVQFTASNRGYAPCHTYFIVSTEETARICVRVKRCDSIARVLEVKPDIKR